MENDNKLKYRIPPTDFNLHLFSIYLCTYKAIELRIKLNPWFLQKKQKQIFSPLKTPKILLLRTLICYPNTPKIPKIGPINWIDIINNIYFWKKRRKSLALLHPRVFKTKNTQDCAIRKWNFTLVLLASMNISSCVRDGIMDQDCCWFKKSAG